ncbi:MAG: sigma 54-interacting transcriptional regulator [Desulfonatronovibrionaceae bacterium]
MNKRAVLFISRPDRVSPFFSRFREHGVDVHLSGRLDAALSLMQSKKPQLVFCEAELAGFRAEDFLQALDTEEDKRKVVVFAEQGTADEAGHMIQLGARDYWLLPLVWEKMEALLPSRSEADPSPEPKPEDNFHAASRTIIGEHPGVQKVLELARRVAPSKASILITGASGTGKELFARYVHEHSPRRGRPFVAVNCAALPEHLLESELFGHEKGAFTGAVSRKPGRFELADGGSLLLDEITEMDPALQAKLLRVLQEGEIDRVGGTESIPVDVRVIATTNRDVQKSVQEGAFREDLFYRLNVIPLKLPELKERGEDVLVLAGYFARRFAGQYSLPVPGFDPAARTWLLEHDWPGNVRELQNLMERAVLLSSDTGVITKAHFLLEGEEEADVQAQGDPVRLGPEEDEVIPLQEMEKRLILKSLKTTGGNRTRASELLGVSVRTLRNKLNEYKKQGLEF